MSLLNRVTLNDRQRLVEALQLPYQELEDYSQLTERLVEMEQREDRLGINILTGLMATVTEIEALNVKISELKTANDGLSNQSEYSQTVVGEYSYSQKSTGVIGVVNGESVLLGSPLASLLSEKESLVKDLHRKLNSFRRQESYPHGYYQQTSQGLILG